MAGQEPAFPSPPARSMPHSILTAGGILLAIAGLYFGRVGTGFPRKLLEWLVPRLKQLEVKESPFAAADPLGEARVGRRIRDH